MATEYSPFKMKGFSGFGNSPVKVAGAFITDEEGVERRATYDETREAEKRGEDVRFTDEEQQKRYEEDVRNQARRARTDPAYLDRLEYTKKRQEEFIKDWDLKKAAEKKGITVKQLKANIKEDRTRQDIVEYDAWVKGGKKGDMPRPLGSSWYQMQAQRRKDAEDAARKEDVFDPKAYHRSRKVTHSREDE